MWGDMGDFFLAAVGKVKKRGETWCFGGNSAPNSLSLENPLWSGVNILKAPRAVLVSPRAGRSPCLLLWFLVAELGFPVLPRAPMHPVLGTTPNN